MGVCTIILINGIPYKKEEDGSLKKANFFENYKEGEFFDD